LSILQRPAAQWLLLVAIAALLLAPSLAGEFVWDDKRLVADSPHIEDLSRVPGYFGKNLMESSGDSGRAADSIDIYRPLYMTALSLLAQVDGKNPVPFHLALLAVHLLAATLLWLLVRKLVPGSGALGAGFAFLAFAIHPVTAESALWISAISEPMAAVGLLGTVWLLSDRPTAARSALATVLYFAGLLSKEVIVMALPPVTIWLLLRGVGWRRIAPLWGAATAMVLLRVLALDGLHSSASSQSQLAQSLKNLGLLWWHGLGGLAAQRPVGPIHLYTVYRDLPAWLGVVGILSFIAVLVALWRLRERAPLLALAVGVHASMLLPVALVTTLESWGGFGRYLYMPLAFLLLGLVQIAPRTRPMLAVAAGWLVLSLAGLPVALEAYSSPIAMAEAGLRLNPEASAPRSWMGEALVDEGRVAESIPWFAGALEIAPDVRQTRINLSASLVAAGRPREALKHIDDHEALFGPSSRSAFIRARSLIVMSRFDEAAPILLHALEQAPDEPNLHWLSVGLLNNHPRPVAYGAWLSDALPDHPKAAAVLEPLLRPESQ
jgi:tetratricopeptide (TPR) repeat protein